PRHDARMAAPRCGVEPRLAPGRRYPRPDARRCRGGGHPAGLRVVGADRSSLRPPLPSPLPARTVTVPCSAVRSGVFLSSLRFPSLRVSGFPEVKSMKIGMALCASSFLLVPGLLLAQEAGSLVSAPAIRTGSAAAVEVGPTVDGRLD